MSFLAVLVLYPALGVAASDHEEAPTQKRPVSKGPSTRNSQVKGVVSIGNCSATLLKPKEGTPPPHSLVMLTASHCMRSGGREARVTFAKGGGKSFTAKCKGNPAYYRNDHPSHDVAACVLPASDEQAVIQEMQGQPMACLPPTQAAPGTPVSVIGFGTNPQFPGQNRSDNVVRNVSSGGMYTFSDGGKNMYTGGDSGGFTGTVGPNGELTIYAIVSATSGSVNLGVDVLSAESKGFLQKVLAENPSTSICGLAGEAPPVPPGAPGATPAPPRGPTAAPTSVPTASPTPPAIPPPSPRPNPDANPRKLLVDKVGKGSLAEETGIQSGDEILAVNGRQVKSIAELRAAIRGTLADSGFEELYVTVLRNGKKATMVLTLDEKTRAQKHLGAYIKRRSEDDDRKEPDPDEDW